MENFVIISGCSGGGKSTLIDKLAKWGLPVVPEPGRRIIAEEGSTGGSSLPWVNLEAFAARAIALSLADRDKMRNVSGWVFFDRGLVDATAALDHAAGTSNLTSLQDQHRYHRQVFLTPPWPEIYRQDDARQHGFDEAVEEYGRLLIAYRTLGYDPVILPKTGVDHRASYILERLHLPLERLP